MGELLNPLMNIEMGLMFMRQFCPHRVDTAHRLLTVRTDAMEKEDDLKWLLKG